MKRRKALKHNTATSDTAVATVDRPAFPQALLDHLLANYQQPSDLIGENGMLKQLTKAVFEFFSQKIICQYLAQFSKENLLPLRKKRLRYAGHRLFVGSMPHQ